MSTFDATPKIYKFELVKRLARLFREDTRGNVALLFGLVAIPLFIGAGMAVDIARHGYHQRPLRDLRGCAHLRNARQRRSPVLGRPPMGPTRRRSAAARPRCRNFGV